MSVRADWQKLSAAKLWLTSGSTAPSDPQAPRDLAYLAYALYALIPVADRHVRRMSCDQWWRVYVDPNWLEQASVPEVARELTHVVWHLLSDHAIRARSLGIDRSTASAWARAADIAVSNTLEPELLSPDWMPTWRETPLQAGRSAEEYFAALSRLQIGTDAGPTHPAVDPIEGCGSGADGLRRETEFGESSDIAAIGSSEAAELRRRVAIQYREVQLARGTDPGDLRRWVTDLLEPRTPWEPVLAAVVRRAAGWAAGRGYSTYTKLSRRSASTPGIILPGQQRAVPRVSIVIDTSASVDDQLLKRALGEIDGVIAALGIPGGAVTVHSVDAAVHTRARVRSATEAELVGAGGTDLRAGLAAAERERPRPGVVIVFTDGDTPWPPAPPPGSAVIVALLGRDDGTPLPPTPAWATRIECLLDTPETP